MAGFNANNLAGTSLSSDIQSGDSSIDVVDDSVFPSTPFRATIEDQTNVEIVEVTSVSSNTLTVERAKEDTSAQSFSSGSDIEQRLTAEMYEQLSTISNVTSEIEDHRQNDVHDQAQPPQNHVSSHESGGGDEISHNSLAISSDDHHSKTSSASELTDVSADSVSNAHHTRFSGDSGDNVTDIPNRDVEDLTSQGASGSVPVSQADGSLQMQEVGGGLERISDLGSLVAYKQSFNTIRNRADWIDYIFQNNESMADEITNSQVLTHYVFESENDAYDRFIDPNHNLGLFAYNNDSEPTISSVYEGAMFLGPTSFLEGLLTIEAVADQITNSQVLMDAVHNGDAIMENNFGYEAGA